MTIVSPPTTHKANARHVAAIFGCSAIAARLSPFWSPESRSASKRHPSGDPGAASLRKPCPKDCLLCSYFEVNNCARLQDRDVLTTENPGQLNGSMAQHHFWADQLRKSQSTEFFLPAIKIPNKFSIIGGSTSSKPNQQISRMVSLIAQIGSNDVPSELQLRTSFWVRPRQNGKTLNNFMWKFTLGFIHWNNWGDFFATYNSYFQRSSLIKHEKYMKRCSEVICKWYMFMHLHGRSWICHIFATGQVVKKMELNCQMVQFLYIIYQIEYLNTIHFS